MRLKRYTTLCVIISRDEDQNEVYWFPFSDFEEACIVCDFWVEDAKRELGDRITYFQDDEAFGEVFRDYELHIEKNLEVSLFVRDKWWLDTDIPALDQEMDLEDVLNDKMKKYQAFLVREEQEDYQYIAFHKLSQDTLTIPDEEVEEFLK